MPHHACYSRKAEQAGKVMPALTKPSCPKTHRFEASHNAGKPEGMVHHMLSDPATAQPSSQPTGPCDADICQSLPQQHGINHNTARRVTEERTTKQHYDNVQAMVYGPIWKENCICTEDDNK